MTNTISHLFLKSALTYISNRERDVNIAWCSANMQLDYEVKGETRNSVGQAECSAAYQACVFLHHNGHKLVGLVPLRRQQQRQKTVSSMASAYNL